MKPVPDISPELYGLLDEIVKDPRSALRLTPRRALLPWMESGEVIGRRPVEASTAERHLLAVHREEVARLLVQAACLAYAERGKPDHLGTRGEGLASDFRASWRTRASQQLQDCGEASALLSQAMVGDLADLDPRALARASLALEPSAVARFYVAIGAVDEAPHEAIHIAQRLSKRARDQFTRACSYALLGSVFMDSRWMDLALDCYARAERLLEAPHLAQFYVFSSACFSGDTREALRASVLLERAGSQIEAQLLRACQKLTMWVATARSEDVARARRTISMIQARLSSPASRLAASIQGQGASR